MTMGLASQTVLPIISSGSVPDGAFGVIEAAGGIDRAIDGEAVLAADDVVLLAVSGRGVDCAGALLERDVIGEDAERIAIEKGMTEDGAFEARAGEAGEHFVIGPAAFFGGDVEEVGGDDVDGIGAA